jgi:hypothetical protein
MPSSRDPLGKHALFWAPGERTDPKPFESKGPVPGKRALFSAPDRQPGAITLECSACRARSHVSYLEFVRRHLPVWLWLPGRRFSRLMSCPACERRAWVRVTWRP